jgi:hypothetical protein
MGRPFSIISGTQCLGLLPVLFWNRALTSFYAAHGYWRPKKSGGANWTPTHSERGTDPHRRPATSHTEAPAQGRRRNGERQATGCPPWVLPGYRRGLAHYHEYRMDAPAGNAHRQTLTTTALHRLPAVGPCAGVRRRRHRLCLAVRMLPVSLSLPRPTRVLPYPPPWANDLDPFLLPSKESSPAGRTVQQWGCLPMKRVVLVALAAAFLTVIALGYAFEADNLERELARLDKAIAKWPENEGQPQPYYGAYGGIFAQAVARATGKPTIDYRPTLEAVRILDAYLADRSATLEHLVALRRWILLAVGVVLFGSIAAYVLAYKPRRSHPGSGSAPK